MTELNKIIAEDVIWRNFFSDEELNLDPFAVTADVYLDRLKKNKEFYGTLKFIGCCLNHREGVWWACRCYSSSISKISPDNTRKLEEILAWVKKPQGSRQPTKVFKDDETENFFSWLEFSSSFYLGEDIPEKLTIKGMEKIPDLAAISYTGAISMLTVTLATDKEGKVNASRLFEFYNKFTNLGISITNGKENWDYL